jgi:hemerythrin-like domain-containing protein
MFSFQTCGQHIPKTLTPIEDLTLDHGIIKRIFLILDKVVERVEEGNFQPAPLKSTLEIIKSFVAGIHERLEEEYVFPVFEKKDLNKTLVAKLRHEHAKGHEIIAQVQQLLGLQDFQSLKNRNKIVSLLKKYNKMYRHHLEQEDTVLFPNFGSLVTEKSMQELGVKFSNREHQLFGKDGHKAVMKTIEDIEKQLGISRDVQ